MELKEIVSRFRKLATASVSDAVDKVTGERGFMSHEIKPIFNCKVVGPAVTVKEVFALKNEGPKMALSAIDAAEDGSVLVISAENAKDYALFGGLMGTGAKVNGLDGAILDGGVRDVNELKEIGFPVFSRSLVPSTTLGRIITVASNIPVTCGDIWVNPGDIIVGDTDGVVVVPKDKAEEVLLKAEEIEEIERQQTEDIKLLKSITQAVEKWSRI